jgi:tRNA-splicing ligase RtcB
MSSAFRAPTTTALSTVMTIGRVPILSWAHPLEGGVLEQARNLADLPCAIDHVALMPDAHTGCGMPIGGVLSPTGPSSPMPSGSTSPAASRSWKL